MAYVCTISTVFSFKNTSPASFISGIVSSISHLHSVGCPSAVAGLIVAVIVNPIQGCVGWAISHVFSEQLIRVPPFANFYTSTAVVTIVHSFRIQAPLSHTHPGHSCRRIFIILIMSRCISVRLNIKNQSNSMLAKIKS